MAIIQYNVFMKILDINNKHIKENQRFEIGSQTKMFTALLIFKAKEINKLSLEDKIEKYLDESLLKYSTNFTEETFSAKGNTIAEIVSHKVILPDFINLSKKHYDDQALYDLFLTFDRTFETHEDFEWVIKEHNKETREDMEQTPYNNTGYYLLTLLIEKVFGMSYEKALSEYIFKPLGMSDSNMDNSDVVGSYKGNTHKFPITLYSGAGGVVSTYSDMNKFITGITKVISIESFKEWKELSNTNALGAGLLNIGSILQGKIEIKGNWWGHLGQTLQYQSGTIINDDNEVLVTAIDDASISAINRFIEEIKK